MSSLPELLHEVRACRICADKLPLGPRPVVQVEAGARLLAHLPQLELTLLVGRYAQQWHLGADETLTETVQNWRRYWPHQMPLPHPSPRNNLWLRRNSWFENELLPPLKERISELRRQYWM